MSISAVTAAANLILGAMARLRVKPDLAAEALRSISLTAALISLTDA